MVPEEINLILARKKLPSVIGSKSFVDKIKEKFFGMKSHEEVPEARNLAPDVDRRKEVVCKHYMVKERDLLVSRRGYFNEPRIVAIYLTRRLRGGTLKYVR